MSHGGFQRKMNNERLLSDRPQVTRVGVIGAGVIGSVFAARLADAGYEVSLLARGERLASLGGNGLQVRCGTRLLSADVTVVSEESMPPVDLLMVAVRTTQLESVLGLAAKSKARGVVFLQHLGGRVGEVVDSVGKERTVLAFPGVGGLVHDDGIVEYVEIGAQPTTIDANAPQADAVRAAIASTGMRTALEADMDGWFATHEVFVSCIGAGILACGGEATALAGDQDILGRVVSAVREGFAALDANGVKVTPAALRVLFGRMPQWFAAAYWRGALRGPVGTIALAPHIRASRRDEFPLLCAHVLESVGRSNAPALTALLEQTLG